MFVANTTQFFTGTMIVLAVALVALLATVGTWTVRFFISNHQTRVAAHRPLVGYYRTLAFSH